MYIISQNRYMIQAMPATLIAPTPAELSVFAPIREDYADFKVPVTESFEWNGILAALKMPPGRFAVLYAFRSVLEPGVDEEKLEALDKLALGAAEDVTGFMHYETNPGLSYCIWEGSMIAAEAVRSSAHRDAAAYASEAYAKWELQSWLVGRIRLPNNALQVEFVPR